ncbi:MAG: hypothetical protein FJ095_21610 [Deltaproteobacteria bacterium]|nr:hypothetical protein [Deltaproteobacteria bacterium]
MTLSSSPLRRARDAGALFGLLGLALALGGCSLLEKKVSRSVKSANHYNSLQPTGSAPLLTGYQFDLGEVVSAEACAEPNTTYQVALAGVSGSPSLGELAAAHAALAKQKDADLLLVIRSEGTRSDSKSCGTFVGRAVKLRTTDLHAPVPATSPGPKESR